MFGTVPAARRIPWQLTGVPKAEENTLWQAFHGLYQLTQTRLAQSALLARSHVAGTIERLDQVRLMMPGTLIEEAARQRADLVVLPELTVTGYPPEDLVLRPTFVAASAKRGCRAFSSSSNAVCWSTRASPARRRSWRQSGSG